MVPRSIVFTSPSSPYQLRIWWACQVVVVEKCLCPVSFAQWTLLSRNSLDSGSDLLTCVVYTQTHLLDTAHACPMPLTKNTVIETNLGHDEVDNSVQSYFGLRRTEKHPRLVDQKGHTLLVPGSTVGAQSGPTKELEA